MQNLTEQVRGNPPHFIIIGAQRCGTTSLFQYLARHPSLALAAHKEIHFFDYQYHKGADWYRNQFPLPLGCVLTGEASPYYLFQPHVPIRIRNWDPDVKLIVLLRNPIDRAYSHYYHEVRMEAEALSFEAAINVEAERLEGQVERILSDPYYYSYNHQHFSYLSRGIYIHQLECWMTNLFCREQVLIVKSEELYSSPEVILPLVTTFLGVPTYQPSAFPKYNDGNYPPMNGSTRKHLLNYFRPYNERLYEYLSRDFGWDT